MDVSSTATVRAAGGIVLRRATDGEWQVLLVHRPRYDDWSLPKGKADPGERDEETALREVEEETGLRCTLGAPAGRTRYRDSKGRDKVVHYWLMQPESAAAAADERVRAQRRGRRGALVHRHRGHRPPHLRARPQAAGQGAGAVVTVYLVRHARAGSRSRWKGDDSCARSRRSGRSQADGIAKRLSREPVDLVVSSPYVRCVGTVEPLAAKLGVDDRDQPTRSPRAPALRRRSGCSRRCRIARRCSAPTAT